MSAPTTVIPLLPACPRGSLNPTDFVTSYAPQFQPLSGAYYTSIIPTMVPGIVVGGLAVVGFIIMTIMLFAQSCSKCLRGGGGGPSKRRDQFITPRDDEFAAMTKPSVHVSGSQVYTYSLPDHLSASSAGNNRVACNATTVLLFLIATFMLATAGVSGWGISITLKDTSYQISDFWSAVSTVQKDVGNVTIELNSLYENLQLMDQYARVILQDSNNIVTAASSISSQFGVSATQVVNDLNSLESTLTQGKSVLNQTLQSLLDANNFVGIQLTTSISQFTNSYKSLTFWFQNTGRIILIGVLFGCTIACSLIAGVLCIKLGNFKLLTTLMVALLWLVVAVLILFGAGFLLGVRRVGNEACLYSETFVLGQVNTYVTDTVVQTIATNALTYYFNQTLPINDSAALTVNTILGNTLGLDLGGVVTFIQGPQLQEFVNLVGSITVSGLLSTELGATTTNAIQQLVQLVEPITNTVLGLVKLASRSNIYPFYESVKYLICCDGAPPASDLFVAWTVVGSLAFVLASLCSLRIFLDSGSSRVQ